MGKKRQDAPAGALAKLITRQSIREHAGSTYFERGEDYFHDGSVDSLTEYEDRIVATVRGTHRYKVKLWVERGDLEHECTCPLGDEGAFCKHCVAVGLAWLEEQDGGKARGKGKKGKSPTLDDVREHLKGLGVDALVEMLMEQVLDNASLRERLLMQVAVGRATSAKGKDGVRALKEAIDLAVEVDFDTDEDYYGYDDDYYGDDTRPEVEQYVQGLDAAVDGIKELLTKGRAAEAMEVAAYALEAIDDHTEGLDVFEGMLDEVVARVGKLHLEACKKVKPDPVVLAEWVFHRDMEGSYVEVQKSSDDYWDLMGAKGQARYRELADEAWAQVPSLAPGEIGSTHWSLRHRITPIMEALARASGDLDELLAVMSRDLSTPDHLLRIAEACKSAGRRDLALEWAERGLNAFPDAYERAEGGLRGFVADEYHRLKRHDEAMALIWGIFSGAPGLGTYQTLKEHATRAKDWPSWRERALEHIRGRIAQERRKGRASRWVDYGSFRDNSLLVEIFLREKDVDAAWQEALDGNCAKHLWLKLAEQRAKDWPQDALAVYQRQVEETVAQTNNDAYSEAVGYIRIMRGLFERLHRSGDFAAYVSSLRETNRRKRNFVKMLDSLR